jgi:hypothetical protein
MIYPSCGSLKEFNAAIQSDIEQKKKPKKKLTQAVVAAVPSDRPICLGIDSIQSPRSETNRGTSDVSSVEEGQGDPIVIAIDKVLSHSKYQAGSNNKCPDVYFRRAEITDAADIRRFSASQNNSF